MLAFSSFLPTIPPKPMLTFSDEDAEDAAEEGDALAALAATARDAKEATDEICVDVFVDDNNAGERERESSSEDEEEAAPILLSAMAVARSMVELWEVELESRCCCWRWSMLRGEEREVREGGESERRRDRSRTAKVRRTFSSFFFFLLHFRFVSSSKNLLLALARCPLFSLFFSREHNALSGRQARHSGRRDTSSSIELFEKQPQ